MAQSAKTLARKATDAAQSAPARQPASSNYTDVHGPVEESGGHGDAFITRSPSGVDYLEHRPRSGGRVKRVPLVAVTAMFPAILDK